MNLGRVAVLVRHTQQSLESSPFPAVASATTIVPHSLAQDWLNSIGTSLLRFDHDMATTVLLVARFRTIVAEGPLFAVGHHGQTVALNPQVHQIVAHCFGTFFCQHKIIGGASTLVTMAFHLNLGVVMGVHPLGIPVLMLSPFLTDHPAVISKENIPKTGSGSCPLFRLNFF